MQSVQMKAFRIQTEEKFAIQMVITITVLIA